MKQGTLADFSRSLFSTLGVPGLTNDLGLSQSAAGRECLVLVDGLGMKQLVEYREFAPHIFELTLEQELITSFPSTTATSIASIGTGLLSGAHGMLGYTVRVPHSGVPGRLLNALKWDFRVDPVVWQPEATLFERAAASGTLVYNIAAAKFAKSGLTEAVLRGATYIGVANKPTQIRETARALRREGSFAYVYLNDVDVAGHSAGVGSDKWLATVSMIDDFVSQLIDALPSGTRVWLTADHGMVNASEQVVLGLNNDLMQDVTLLGGEPRARHIYVRQGSENHVLQRWHDGLGSSVQVFTKDEAISTGLFGDVVTESAHARIGDLVAIAQGALALIDPTRVMKESAIVGHHGGTSEAEVLVPLFSGHAA